MIPGLRRDLAARRVLPETLLTFDARTECPTQIVRAACVGRTRKDPRVVVLLRELRELPERDDWLAPSERASVGGS